MKIIVSKTETSIINRALCRRGLLWSFGLTAALASFALRAESVGAGHYRQINLVADVAGVAQLQDPDLVNAWGISFSATSPFWVSDNGTGKSTLYSVTNDTLGNMVVAKLGLIVSIPGRHSYGTTLQRNGSVS